MEPQGVGALQLAFQQLKERLAKEGLFAEARKKPLPLLPRTIGIVTSPTGAAIHDILNVLGRRHAGVHILILPVKVQGEGSAEEVAVAVRDLNVYAGVDVIIVGRGGGSMEDLWAFNEEVVARAIFASRIPVVSAVGHEVDFTIADFVADLRAPTPSAAAELVVASKAQLVADCNGLERRLHRAMQQHLSAARGEMLFLQKSLKGPELVIARLQQRVDDLCHRRDSAIDQLLATSGHCLLHWQTRLQHSAPLYRIRNLRERLENLDLRNRGALGKALDTARGRFEQRAASLEALSPLAVLGRGFAIVEKIPSGRIVKSARQLQQGESLQVRLRDGSATCTVESVSFLEIEKLDSHPPHG